MRRNLALMGVLAMASATMPTPGNYKPEEFPTKKNQQHWGEVNRQGSRPTKKTNLRSCKLKAKHKKRLKMKSRR